jgi:16S rRNA (guanine527-N7)-methyltransferase
MEYNVKRFITALQAENEKHNLISRKSLPEDINKHIDDSLQIFSFIEMNDKKVADIGTGAGFPGLIMAMARPNMEMTLIESDQKKSTFLQQMVKELQLNNVTVIKNRVEEIGRDPNFRGNFDYCTSRAVTSVNVLLEYGIPLLKTGGKLLLWKGRNYKNELEQAEIALELLNAKVIESFHYTLMQDLDRTIVEIEKLAETPQKYPRRTGIPAKRPL